jgi:ubiquinone/menaquinone biosynthesis C-methylase UbiE
MRLPIVQEKTQTKRERYEARMERKRKLPAPEKLGPQGSAMDQVRIERTVALLEKHSQIKGERIADLGCGTAWMASLLAERGGHPTAVDLFENISESGQRSQISYQRAAIPYLPFPDASFDGLVFSDVIAEIDPPLYRLTFSELARLLTRSGWIICSTQLDLYSEDAHERFIGLIESEFEIIDSAKSHNRLHVYLTRWAKAPFRFLRAGAQKEYRMEHLQKRSGLMRLWFYLNSIKFISLLWKPIASLFFPLLNLLKSDRRLLLFAERLSKALWGRKAMTHVIVVARKKKISYNR